MSEVFGQSTDEETLLSNIGSVVVTIYSMVT